MKRVLPLLLPLLASGCLVMDGTTTYSPAPRRPAPPPPAPAMVVVEPSRAAPPPAMTPPPPPQYAPPPTVVVVEHPPLPDAEIVRVYEDLLGRRPSPHEVREWRDRSRQVGMSADDLRREMRGSREFQMLAPETIIVRAYREFQHRDPDAAAMRYYRRKLIDEHWSAGQVRESIAHRDDRSKPEPRHEDDRGRRGRGSAADARDSRWREAEINPGSPDVVIERAYEDLLERAPDQTGRDRYRRLLQQGGSEADLRAKIRQSEEYRVTLPDAKTTRAYREVLGREPDPVGLEGFRHKIVDNGWTEEDVKNYLRQTDEYKRRNK